MSTGTEGYRPNPKIEVTWDSSDLPKELIFAGFRRVNATRVDLSGIPSRGVSYMDLARQLVGKHQDLLTAIGIIELDAQGRILQIPSLEPTVDQSREDQRKAAEQLEREELAKTRFSGTVDSISAALIAFVQGLRPGVYTIDEDQINTPNFYDENQYSGSLILYFEGIEIFRQKSDYTFSVPRDEEHQFSYTITKQSLTGKFKRN